MDFTETLTMIMMMFLLVIIGVGRKVKIRELTAIADDDDHVISVRKYASLQKAIKKAVYTKIGKNAILLITSSMERFLRDKTFFSMLVVCVCFYFVSCCCYGRVFFPFVCFFVIVKFSFVLFGFFCKYWLVLVVGSTWPQ